MPCQSALLMTCYPAPHHQPERPGLTTTCPIMRKKSLPHRQIHLAISSYGNNGSGTWTMEEKTWSTAVAIMSKLQILTQQNQAKSHTAPIMQQPIIPTGYCKACLPASHPMPYVLACNRWVTPSCIYCHLLVGSASPISLFTPQPLNFL